MVRALRHFVSGDGHMIRRPHGIVDEVSEVVGHLVGCRQELGHLVFSFHVYPRGKVTGRNLVNDLQSGKKRSRNASAQQESDKNSERYGKSADEEQVPA